MDRPQTPPTAQTERKDPLTPEQIKRIEINRLKAKARLRATQEVSKDSPASQRNANNKRPLSVVPVTNTSPTVAPNLEAGPSGSGSSAPNNDHRPLKPDTKFMGRYLDYDLSKMVDSRGGFLIEERAGIDESERKKLLARERERMKQSLDPPVFLDPAMNPKCRECGSMSIDPVFKNIFRCVVCKKCMEEFPEKYSLLTKTECKEDYLLTDPELRDEELLPHLLKANPHHATWNNMMLFLRYQVEEFAWKKWGSPEALDAEYERRVEEKRRKKSKKFEDGLRDLRKKTREGVWQRRKDEEHVHDFDDLESSGDGSAGRQRCKGCGFEIEVEIF